MSISAATRWLRLFMMPTSSSATASLTSIRGRTMRECLKHDVAPGLPPAPEGTVRLTGLAGLSDFVAKADPELAANAILCAVNQAAYLLHRQIESQSRNFVAQGGFTERLYAARVKARASDKSDK